MASEIKYMRRTAG